MDKEFEEMRKMVCNQCPWVLCEKGESCEFANNIARVYYNAGYRKAEVNTVGDKIRSMIDKELAKLCTAESWNELADERCYISILTHGAYDIYEEAYQANLDFLKQEHKGDEDGRK